MKLHTCHGSNHKRRKHIWMVQEIRAIKEFQKLTKSLKEKGDT